MPTLLPLLALVSTLSAVPSLSVGALGAVTSAEMVTLTVSLSLALARSTVTMLMVAVPTATPL